MTESAARGEELKKEGRIEKAEIKKMALRMLGEIREFLSPGQDLRAQIERIMDSEVLNFDNYQALVAFEQAQGRHFIGHDLKNTASTVLGRVQMWHSPRSAEREKKELPILSDGGWRLKTYLLVMEDILLRLVDDDRIAPKYQRPIVFQDILEAVTGLKEEKDKLQNKYGDGGEWLEIRNEGVDLKDDEGLYGCPGLVANGLLNIIRNAREAEIGAKRVILEVKREGVEVAVRVIDDGRGMSSEHLDEKSKNNVFLLGRSHRKSSGYGLANMPSRMDSTDTLLTVATFLQPQKYPIDRPESALVQDSFSFYQNQQSDEEQTAEKWTEWRQEVRENYGFLPSTMFELRLPILKKK